MADRIAIIGGEPYAEWIERDGNAPDIMDGCVAVRLSKDAHYPLLAGASPVPGRRRMMHGRHVLGVPPFFTPSACRVALASNIIIINQTRKGKDNDHSN